MGITNDFNYERPASLNKAMALRTSYGASSSILAGGTDLIVNLKDENIRPKMIIDIKDLGELKKVEYKDNILHIGALVTFSELLDSRVVLSKFPILWESCKSVASTAIRNRATLVGNLCSAVPSLDSAPSLLVHEATIVARSEESERKIKIEDWFSGPKKTVLKNNEIVTEVSLSFPDVKYSGSYLKLGRYKGEDLAQVCVSTLVFAKNIYRVAFGAVGPTPKRANKIENILNGKKINKELVDKAKKMVEDEISPITDIRASKEYRTHMARVMLERSLNISLLRFAGKGEKYGENVLV